MPTTVQFRRGTTAQNNAFTGAVGEITIDTDKDTIVIHDGATQGGFPLISSNDSDPTFSSSTASKPQLTLTNTADDATGPVITIQNDRATPADNDVAGTIKFVADDDAGAQITVASLTATITDVSNGTEDGKLVLAVEKAGSTTDTLTLDPTGVTVNAGILVAPTGSTVGNLTLANGSITDSSGTIDFDNENLTTTGTVTYGSLSDGTITITAFVDEDNMASNSATLVPTQQSVKAYVDAQVTAQDLDATTDSGTIAIDLDSETLTIAGGEGIDTSATGNTITIAGEDASTSNKGVASFSSDNFAVASGAVTIKDGGVANAELANSSVNFGGVTVALGASDTTPAFDLSDATAYPGDSSLVTTGALNSGSITSGFGSIDVGSSAITTTGTITGGIGVFDNIRIDNTAGEIDTSSGNLTIDSAGGTVTVDDNLEVSGNATITGNLTVNGTTTTVATSNTVVSDSLIELANGTTGTPSNDAGIVIERGDSNNAFIGFDESEDKFKVGTGTFTGASTGNLTISTGTLVANIEGDVTGNASTATTLETARNIGGVSFNGSANINLPGVNTAGSQDTSGNAATATALETGRTIGLSGDVTATGVSFDGTGDITLSTTIAANSVALGTDTTGSYVQQGATSGNGISGSVNSEGGTFTVTSNATNANTGSTIVFRDASGNFSAGTITAALSGNATTATTLQTARNIGGVSFNGSANINLPGVNTTGNQDTTGTATNATNFNVAADNSTNATHYVIFTGGATGNQRPNSDTALTYNPSTNILGTTASSAQYADLAEMYSADGEYEPGTVMSFGGDQEITQSVQSHDARVAGVVSTAPAYLMNADLENGTALALQGRTPVKVIGRIHKGDMLVASQTPGVACAVNTSFYTPGCVIGKALASYDSNTVGTIEVVVGRI